jgi:hypothetical protein
VKLPDGTELPDDSRLENLAGKLGDSFKIHQEQPNVSFRKYRARNRRALGKTVASKIRIYLDTRYWIHIREARLGRPKKPEHERIYKLLHKLVSSGKVLCPASFPSFHELLKHKNQQVRRASAEILDELSGQICLINPIELMRSEIMAMFRQFTPDYPLPVPLLEAVWTKAGYWAGEMVLKGKNWPPDYELIMQKICEDMMNSARFSDIVESYFNSKDNSPSDDNMRILNEGFSKFSAGAKSLQQLYRAQVILLIQENNSLTTEALKQICDDMFGKTIEQCGDFVESLIGQAYHKALKTQIATDMPGVHIISTLQTAIAWNKQRTFKANDINDIIHARSALPYYDYIFVERGFCHLLIAPPNKLAETYGTKVFWKEADVIRELEMLEQKLV